MNNRKLRKSVAFVASVCIVTASLGGCGSTSDYVDKLEYFNEDEGKKYNYSFTYNDVYEACCKELGL